MAYIIYSDFEGYGLTFSFPKSHQKLAVKIINVANCFAIRNSNISNILFIDKGLNSIFRQSSYIKDESEKGLLAYLEEQTGLIKKFRDLSPHHYIIMPIEYLEKVYIWSCPTHLAEIIQFARQESKTCKEIVRKIFTIWITLKCKLGEDILGAYTRTFLSVLLIDIVKSPSDELIEGGLNKTNVVLSSVGIMCQN